MGIRPTRGAPREHKGLWDVGKQKAAATAEAKTPFPLKQAVNANMTGATQDDEATEKASFCT